MSGQSLPGAALEQPEAPSAVEVRFAYSLLENLHNQVRIADEKIRALFSGSALLAAALSVNASRTWVVVASGGLTPFELISISFRGVLLVTVAISLFSAIVALLPRIVPRGARRSLFFFGHIAEAQHDDFIAEFSRMGGQTSLEQILSQVHVNAQIVQRKYVWTRRAASSFMAAILVWIVVQLIEFLL